MAALRKDGHARDVFLKAYRTGPILILNDISAQDAPARLAGLPFVQHNSSHSTTSNWTTDQSPHKHRKEIPAMSKPDMPGRIMIVDDDVMLTDVIGRYLTYDGHQVDSVREGREALRRVAHQPPDVVILDLMLPGLNGLEVCRLLRESSPIPVVMLTALGEETDRVVGFEVGADDYVTKPFSPRELALRVRSVLRRSRGVGMGSTPSTGVISDRDLTVDLVAHEIRLRGELLTLTSREYDLLVFLMCHPRQAFTREQLVAQVWNWSFGDTSTVTVHVRRLRKKIEQDPALPERIVTVWGVGYRYQPEDQ